MPIKRLNVTEVYVSTYNTEPMLKLKASIRKNLVSDKYCELYKLLQSRQTKLYSTMITPMKLTKSDKIATHEKRKISLSIDQN